MAWSDSSGTLEWWRPDVAAVTASSPAVETKAQGGAVAFWALMAFTFILLVSPQSFFPVLEPFRLALVSAAFAAGAYLLERFFRREAIGLLTREMAIVAGLVALAILTVPFSYWPGGSVSVLFDIYLKTLVVFWLLGNTVNTLDRLRKVAWGLSLMAVPLALTAVRNSIAGIFIRESIEVKRIDGYGAFLTGNPNDLALMLNLILPLTAALFLIQRRTGGRILLLGMILLDAIAVMLTFSRGGFLTLAVLCLWGIWRLKSWVMRLGAIAAMVFFVFFLGLFSSSYTERLGTIVDIEADPTDSAQWRWKDTLAAVRLVARNPIIGAGMGMNVLALNQEIGASHWNEIHNVYLEYAVDLGLPGLFLFTALLIACLKNASFVRKRCQGVPGLRELFHLAGGIELSLIAFSVAALFYPVGYQFYFYYLAGLAVAVKAIYLNGGADRSLEKQSGFLSTKDRIQPGSYRLLNTEF